MDKATLFKKVNDAIRADKSLDFLHIKTLKMGLQRGLPAYDPEMGFMEDSAPIEVTITVEFHSNETIE